MGVCDSNINDNNNKKGNDSLSSLGNYSTGTFTKNNNKNKNNLYTKQKDGYILPENISKRTDINKYYNITQKILFFSDKRLNVSISMITPNASSIAVYLKMENTKNHAV